MPGTHGALDTTGWTTPGHVPLAALRRLAGKAARGKRASGDVARFLVDIDAALLSLAHDLAARRYAPGRPRTLRVRDPKPRVIAAMPFRDRVAQHVLMARTMQAIERRMAPQSFACREGFGTHRALRRACDWTRARAWVLRVDIRKFFPSIDHAILRRQLLSVTPPAWRWLSDAFLDAPYAGERVPFHFPGDHLLTPAARPHGLAIGSLTSQIWANLYVSPIDHRLASLLRIGSFVRYCDDWLVWDDDPGRLRDALAAMNEAALGLRLRLHPAKSRLHRTTDPVPFLGFVLRRRGEGVSVRIRKENVRRFRARAEEARALYLAGAIEAEELGARVCAWLAHARHGHTTRLVERVLGDLVF